MVQKITQALLIVLLSVQITLGQGNELAIGSADQEIGHNSIRYLLNKLSFTFMSGYGQTFYSHRLDNFGVVKNPAFNNPGLYLFSMKDLAYNQPIYAVQNWLNNPKSSMITLVERTDTARMIQGDSSHLAYRGTSSSIPLTLKVHYNFLNRFRAGAGVTVEFHHLPVLKPVNGFDIIGYYTPDSKKTIFIRYYGMIGARVYQWMGWTYFVDLEVGNLNMGHAFNKAAISKGLYFNIGLPMEYEISEYLKIVVRPSFEYKSYNINIGTNSGINHQYPSFYLNLGFTYIIPEIPRCTLKARTPAGYDYPKKFTNKSCLIPRKHVHGNLAFRGQPFYKQQNPEIGQNQPNLVKFRFFNRHKLSGGY